MPSWVNEVWWGVTVYVTSKVQSCKLYSFHLALSLGIFAFRTNPSPCEEAQATWRSHMWVLQPTANLRSQPRANINIR